jgi:hypothetical protein
MSTEIVLRNFANMLPSNLSYSESSDVFLTNGYVSAARNVYFNAVRFAEGIIIKEDVGQGYLHTFLNGIRIYSIESKTLLADKSYHCFRYNKESVYREVRELLLNLICEAAEQQGRTVDKNDARRIIEKILHESFNTNQLQVAQKQVKRLLPGR